MSSIDIKKELIPNIQYLRALAVVLVIGSHFELSGFSGGFVGVDIFFVISGFLITKHLVGELREKNSISLSLFYTRRVRRLVPALLMVLVSSSIVGYLLLTNYQFLNQTRSLPASSFWLSNIYFYIFEHDYFNDLDNYDFYLHTWSLGVEEQFYLFWPILIIVCYKLAIKDFGDISSKLLVAFLLVTFISLSLSLYSTESDNLFAFYMLPARAWQFAFGGASYIIVERIILTQAKIGTMSKVIIVSLSMVTIAYSVLYFDSKDSYPSWRAILPTLSASLILLVSNATSAKPASQKPLSKLLLWVGNHSYSLYLWHWPIIVIAKSLISDFTWLDYSLLLLLLLFLSSLSYKFIEFPFWKGKYRKISSRNLVLSVLLLSAMISISYYHLSHKLGSYISEHSIQAMSYRDVSGIYEMGCDSWYHSSDANGCLLTSGSKGTAILLSDSVGAQWEPALTQIFAENDWTFILFTKSACPIVFQDYYYERIKSNYEVCSIWKDNLIGILSEMKPELVILGNSNSYPFTQSEWTEGTMKMLTTLESFAKQSLIIESSPALSFSGAECIDRYSKQLVMKTPDLCSEPLSEYKGMVAEAQRNAVKNYNRAGTISLNAYVCPNRICKSLTENGSVVFRDNQHLTKSFVLKLKPVLENKLERYIHVSSN
ncbi:MAG: acyltransferase [Gammaproteobacteria bacterium]|nr:acyltransferase [Gammaproteobacteria bacterium]